MKRLYTLISNGEDRIMKHLYGYTLGRGYAKYTSTLEEAWRVSVRGLSAPLLELLERTPDPPELGPDDDYTTDPVAAFGVIEAKLHRSRGITLSMFLGLMKYYRQAYIDVVQDEGYDREFERKCILYINRFFDRVEVAFCAEWASLTEESAVAELQAANRLMTNEKNKYLTVYESLYNPVIIVKDDGRIDNMNHAAVMLFESTRAPGAKYYNKPRDEAAAGRFVDVFPWLESEFAAFAEGNEKKHQFQKSAGPEDSRKTYEVAFSRMLDISEIFAGTIVRIGDVTERTELKKREREAELIRIRLDLLLYAGSHTLDEFLVEVLDRAEELTGSSIGFYHFVSSDQKTLSLQAWSTRTSEVFCKAEGKGMHYDIDRAGVWVDCIMNKDIVIHNDYAALPHRKGLPEGHSPVIRELLVPVMRNGIPVAVMGVGNKADLYNEKDASVASYIADVAWEIAAGKLAEEELIRLRKIESVGTLAGGIAHDFNNSLASILGGVDYAMEIITEDPAEASEALALAKKAIHGARGLTQQLLTFARGGSPVINTASLRELLTEMCGFVLHGSATRAECNVPDDLWSVHMDTGQISQVIQNLIVNASQAMSGEGVIKLTARNEELEADSPPLKAGAYVRVDVTDTGAGIPREHLPHIFDPYYTTKAKGQGLGLATVMSIILKHSGHISVESHPGEGSTFTFWLPATKENEQRAETVEKEVPAKTGAGLRVLVMDDNKQIRELTMRGIGKKGGITAGAENGEDAIRMYREAMEAGEPFDVVVLDLTVPGGMGGRQTLFKIKEFDPHVRAIVASGYASDPVLANHTAYGFAAMVAKPFELSELWETIIGVAKQQ